jgi:hypothetical protein
MRSYNYDKGEFKPCKDTLPATVSKDGDYTARQNYEQALKKLGFSTWYTSKYISRMGEVTIYARDHATLTPERKANETFDFLCVLSIGGSYIRIWIADLLNLYLFLSDLDAKPKEDSWLKDFLQNADIYEAIYSLKSALNDLSSGDIEITVKPPKPSQRR